MRSLLDIMRRGLGRLERRLSVARPGTILIMVVVLLVLLALIGTAYMATSRVDRSAAAQNSANVQVDMLVQGVEEVALTTIINHLFDANNAYRPAPPNTATGVLSNPGYQHLDGFDLQPTATFSQPNDAWLASRIPLKPTDLSFSPNGPTVTGSSPLWESISYPPIQNVPGAAGPSGTALSQFEDPTVNAVNGNVYPMYLPKPAINNGNNGGFQPTFITLNGTQYPALTWTDPSNRQQTILAADTDGDGIADAGLFRLPIGTINDITYYGAIRIIDNNSAINVNTAYGPEAESNGGTSVISGAKGFYPTWFPSSVDLQDMLYRTGATDELDSADSGATVGGINYWRYNALLSTTPSTTSLKPTDDRGNSARSDFVWLTLGDALWNNLGRRIDNPAYVANSSPAARFHGFSYSDSIGLATNFCLISTSPTSNIELRLPYTAGAQSTFASVSPYLASNVTSWFNSNFDYVNHLAAPKTTTGGTTSFNTNGYPIRALLVARNLLSNAIQAHSLAPLKTAPFTNIVTPTSAAVGTGAVQKMTDYTVSAANPNPPTPVKASLNTAPVADLWRAFWNVMCDDLTVNNTGQPPAYLAKYQGIFGTTICDPKQVGLTQQTAPTAGDYFTPASMMLLRAAIAAQNVCNLRGGTYDICLHDNLTGGNLNQMHVQIPSALNANADETIYGVGPQPFITEIYVQNDNQTVEGSAKGPNPNGYIAIELYNPYPFQISLQNCHFATLNRTTTNASNMTMTMLGPVGGNAWVSNGGTGAPYVIQPYSWLVVENYSQSTSSNGAALYRPKQSGLPPTGPVTMGNAGFAYAPEITAGTTAPFFNTELVLVRGPAVTFTATGTIGSDVLTYKPMSFSNGGDAIPMDQIDLTGFTQATTMGPFTHVHYVRANPANGSMNDPNAWMFVYPGKYTPSAAAGTYRGEGMDPPGFGTAGSTWPVGGTEPAFTATTVALGTNDSKASYSNPYLPIQLTAFAWGGRYAGKSGQSTNNVFPFGGFARVGDMIETPFVGAYRILKTASGTGATAGTTMTGIVDMCSVTRDVSFAHDYRNDNTDYAQENIGRLVPIGNPTSTTLLNRIDYQDPAGSNTDPTQYRYQFAMKIFDYFTVLHNPDSDYTPNFDPGTDRLSGSLFYPPGSSNPPVIVANGPTVVLSSAANQGFENSTGTDGFININTAPWKVLATLPLVPKGNNDGQNSTDPYRSEQMAKAIVYFRDVDNGSGKPHGPFKSLFELNEVPGFQTCSVGGGTAVPTPPDESWGDYFGDPGQNYITPFFGRPNNPADWESSTLMVNRLSNLVSTRSDSYTVYVQVQGWRNAGQVDGNNNSLATLVVQRRGAFIMDRSGVTATNRNVPMYTIPMH